MLEYEKRLHFDEHYKKLQENQWLRTVVCLMWSTGVYITFFCFLRCAVNYVPDKCAFINSKELFTFGSIRLLKIDLLYFLGGLAAICYASIRLIRITTENHSVRDKGLPCRVLTDGYYSKVRHPMYGTFIIMYSGILLSFRSLNGVLITVLIVSGQYCNAFLEEKRLRSLFKEEYISYCSNANDTIRM